MEGDGIAEYGHRASSVTYLKSVFKIDSDVERDLRHGPNFVQTLQRVGQQESFRPIKRYICLLS